MKFSFFSPYYADGGVASTTTRLAEQFEAAGHETELVTFQHDSPFLEDGPFNVVDLEARRTATAVPGLARYYRRTHPDVVLSTHYYANIVSVLAKLLSRTSPTLVLTERIHIGTVLRNSNRPKDLLLLKLMRLTYPRAEHVVTVSKDAADDLADLVGIPRSDVQAIYNPTLVEEVYQKAEEPVEHPWFSSESPEVILGVGRLAPEKDFRTLLEAFASVTDERETRLIVLGDGPEHSSLETRAAELEVADRVDFPGFVDNPYTYMRNADLFVLSSKLEGMPNVLVEALAVGTPVVATDCPSGPRELLADGRYGELVPVGDHAAMSDAIERQLSDPERTAEQIAEVQSTLKQFRPNRSAAKYLDLVDAGHNF